MDQNILDTDSCPSSIPQDIEGSSEIRNYYYQELWIDAEIDWLVASFTSSAVLIKTSLPSIHASSTKIQICFSLFQVWLKTIEKTITLGWVEKRWFSRLDVATGLLWLLRWRDSSDFGWGKRFLFGDATWTIWKLCYQHWNGTSIWWKYWIQTKVVLILTKHH